MPSEHSADGDRRAKGGNSLWQFPGNQKWAGLVQPPDFRPPFVLPATAAPEVAYVWKTEEKGSDVNLGVHLVRDAFKGHFDLAAVFTNDTDLVEPVRIVTQELNGTPFATIFLRAIIALVEGRPGVIARRPTVFSFC
jgi:hypothetical protein